MPCFQKKRVQWTRTWKRVLLSYTSYWSFGGRVDDFSQLCSQHSGVVECVADLWTSGVAGPKILGGAEYLAFKRGTVFGLRDRLAKHKTSRYARNSGVWFPLPWTKKILISHPRCFWEKRACRSAGRWGRAASALSGRRQGWTDPRSRRSRVWGCWTSQTSLENICEGTRPSSILHLAFLCWERILQDLQQLRFASFCLRSKNRTRRLWRHSSFRPSSIYRPIKSCPLWRAVSFHRRHNQTRRANLTRQVWSSGERWRRACIRCLCTGERIASERFGAECRAGGSRPSHSLPGPSAVSGSRKESEAVPPRKLPPRIEVSSATGWSA